jgi:2'-5' RNA ligase
MPRIFLAIDIPQSHREHLQLVHPPQAAGLRPVREGQLHLTLHFLGDLSQPQLLRLLDAAKGVVFETFHLTVAGVGRFPQRGRASVLWAGIRPSSGLIELHAAVGRVLSQLGIPVESRPYAPHVTLARLTPQASPRLTEDFLATHAGLSLPEMSVTSFVVYESQKTDCGSAHVPLLRVNATENRLSLQSERS